MAKNTLLDLNNHLFAQLERLSDEDITPQQLEHEVNRAKAMSIIARNIIDNATVTLEGTKFVAEQLPQNQQVPDQFKLKAKDA